MQETKCHDEAFPVDELAAAGYHAVHHSAGRWAGGGGRRQHDGRSLRLPVSGLPGGLRGDEARWIEPTVGGLRVVSSYVPNGRQPARRPFDEKLADALGTCIPTRSALRGWTTVRATSTARWACASTSCSYRARWPTA
jgi:exonuclease III